MGKNQSLGHDNATNMVWSVYAVCVEAGREVWGGQTQDREIISSASSFTTLILALPSRSEISKLSPAGQI